MNFTFREENSKKLRFKVPAQGNFAEVLKAFNDIKYPPTGVADEQLTFVILELLSNAMRAHREKDVREPIIAEMVSTGEQLLIIISDRGGGFDPARLPYKIEQDVTSIDIMSDAFVKYREEYSNSRFGMGLVATRKVFPLFKLAFIDESANEHAWPSDKIVGTMITLGIPLLGQGA